MHTLTYSWASPHLPSNSFTKPMGTGPRPLTMHRETSSLLLAPNAPSIRHTYAVDALIGERSGFRRPPRQRWLPGSGSAALLAWLIERIETNHRLVGSGNSSVLLQETRWMEQLWQKVRTGPHPRSEGAVRIVFWPWPTWEGSEWGLMVVDLMLLFEDRRQLADQALLDWLFDFIQKSPHCPPASITQHYTSSLHSLLKRLTGILSKISELNNGLK
jgi:hypothetical protein